MRSSDNAQRALRASLNAIREIEGPHANTDAETARNVLHEELGYFGEYERPAYGLDAKTTEIMLVHARQDAAHAAISASRSADLAASILRQSNAILILLAANIALTVYLLWRTF